MCSETHQVTQQVSDQTRQTQILTLLSLLHCCLAPSRQSVKSPVRQEEVMNSFGGREYKKKASRRSPGLPTDSEVIM
jgi:hypothetical protein